uniref:Uncharacterized protein n=1 Tax=Vibrio phage P018-4 TaxID=3229728 RepID=A0AB39AJE9_9CAUD
MLKVTLLDSVTNVIKVYPDTDINVFQWTENNWSCDCNREIAFLEAGESLDFNKDCSHGRYKVIDAEGDFEGFTKEEFIKECNSY